MIWVEVEIFFFVIGMVFDMIIVECFINMGCGEDVILFVSLIILFSEMFVVFV